MTRTTNTNTQSYSVTWLSIRQQNMNRSLVAQSDFLHQLDPNIYDMGAIQEPYLDCLHNSRATPHWFTVYPKEHYSRPEKTRVLLLVNKRIATDAWSQVDFGSSDVTAIQLSMDRSKILIANIYNDAEHQKGLKKTIQLTRSRLQAAAAADRAQSIIWVGDFNLHHPLWDETRNTHLFTRTNLEKVQCLIDASAKLDLQMALPKGTPTLHASATGNYTRPDNVFISSTLTDTLICCTTRPDERPARTDHFPIVTQLDTGADTQADVPQPNYRCANWDKVRKELAVRLAMLHLEEHIHSEVGFFSCLNELTCAISDTVDQHIPKTKPAPFQKRWWTRELADRRRELCKVARKAYSRRSEPEDPIHHLHRTARRAYSVLIENAKRTHWANFLGTLDEKSMWTAHQYASGDPMDGGRTHIP